MTEAVQKTLVGFLAGTGIIGVIAAGMMAVANDARIAINVAEQHGQEILILRGEVASLREEMVSRTRDRYTANDHIQYDRFIQERLDNLEEHCGCK